MRVYVRIRSVVASMLMVAAAPYAVPAGQGKSIKEPFLPPQFITLGSYGNNARVQINCDGQAPFTEMQCRFIWLNLRRLSDEEDKKARAELADLDKATDSDIAKLKAEFSGDFSEKLRARMVRATPEQTSYFAEVAAIGREIAAAPTRAELKVAMGHYDDLEKATCTITVTQTELTFARSGDRRWISNPGPQGQCNGVAIGVLEVERGNLWKYTSTTVSADIDRKICADIFKSSLNKSEEYSWASPDTIAGCKYLTLE